MQTKPGNTKLLLFIILILGLGIRVFWGLRQSSDLSALPDQQEYLDLGKHLAAHQGMWFSDPRFGQIVYAYRTPGYPLLIALCRGSLRTVRLVQAALDTSTILAIYLLGRRLLSPRAALAAAAILAINPYLIFFTGAVLTETLYTSMLAWGMFLLISSDGPWPADSNNRTAWLGGAILLTLSIMVRPGGFLLPMVLAIGAALLNYRRGVSYRNRWPLPVASTMLLLAILVMLPWSLRNRNQPSVQSWIWTSTNDGITRFDGFNPEATGASDQSFVKRMPWLSSMSEVGRSEYLAAQADEYIHQHPGRALELALHKIARTWSPMPLGSTFGGKWYYVAAGVFYGTGFYILILFGLLRKGMSPPAKRYLLLPALYITASVALSVGSLRYRIPAEPPMALIAASAIWKKTSV